MIGIGSDHGGYELKTLIMSSLKSISFMDFGTDSMDRVDYPVFADVCCEAIISGKITAGILICGTGIGISMRANRFMGIRAALVHDEFTAKMAKAHNNANVLCLGGRTTPIETAVKLITCWLDTSFEQGRHLERIKLLDSPNHSIGS